MSDFKDYELIEEFNEPVNDLVGPVGMGAPNVEIDLSIISNEWKWGSDSRYCLVSGLIRSIELRLINKERFLRFVEAKSTEEILSMLGDTDYARVYQEDIGALYGYDLEIILKEEEDKVKKTINELTADKKITDLLFLRNDFFNLKLALKEIFRGREKGDAYSTLGLIPPETIYQEAIEPEKSQELPPLLKETAIMTKNAYENSKNPIDIDLTIDSVMFAHITKIAKKARSLFFFKLLSMEIDMINILTFFRLRWLEESQDTFLDAFIDSGSILKERFVDIFFKEVDELETDFGATEFRDLVGNGMPYLKGENTFFRMESLIDNEFMRILDRAKFINFGIEILIAYYYLKDIEIRKMRTVILGKENGLEPQDLKLRLGYV